ncbi:hypothetical protein [Aquimarina sp. Aq78]|uniref:hypothetical protein n=1 Tax=Aquimarina sp. Aq78 TaxID=1191889 RepID=UPI000D0F1F95|nr:hypothetical protein [Aquimarina sp. Aq78]
MNNSINLLLALFSLFITSSSSCSIYNRDNSNKIEPTHILKNDIILEPIQQKIKNEISKDPLLNVILLRIDSTNTEGINIYLKASNFQTEQQYFKLESNPLTPKGYFVVNNVVVIIYNDVEMFFDKIKKSDNILETKDEVETLVDIHTSYKHYIYHEYNINENKEEYLEYKGEIDDIDR